MRKFSAVLLFSLGLAACGDDPSKTDDREQATLDVKSYINGQLDALYAAAVSLQGHAPQNAWSRESSPGQLDLMRADWKDARNAYERIEGAIAVLFEDLDYSTDARYEMFLEDNGPDDDLFDGANVMGMHGIERILWADQQADEVVAFESGLSGYVAPAYPSQDSESATFKGELIGRLVDDFAVMRDSFRPLALDSGDAYRGVIGSMAEQVEKVNLAATGEDESRYARHTLADMRANLAGGREIYAAFRDWLKDQPNGQEADTKIIERFDAIQARYAALPGDSLPPIPAGWNPDAPDTSTEYGSLFVFLVGESDETNPDSLVARMMAGAEILGIPTDN